MAKRSSHHVPKFGTWEGEDVAYTAYFETARKGRGGGGGRIINPNDPEERHELIKFREEQQHHAARSHHGVAGLSYSTTTTASNINTPNKISNVNYAPQRRQQEKAEHHNKKVEEADAFAGRTRSPYNYNRDRAQHRDRMSSTDAPRNHKDIGSTNSPGFGGELEGYSSSSSAHSHQGQPQSKKDQIRQRRDYPPATSSPQQPILMPRTKKYNQQPEVQQHRKAASVPKFGAWDVTSHQAEAAGFTMIFDKVKEERQQAAKKLRTAPLATPAPYSPQERMSDHKQAKSKMFCCFLPMVD